MPTVDIDYIKLESRDHIATLSVQLGRPVTQLAVSVFAHDSIDVAWRVGVSLKPTEDPLLWTATWRLNSTLSRLLEIGNINTTGAPSWASLRPEPHRWVFLQPDAANGSWIAGERALEELDHIESLREQRFTSPLLAPGTPNDSPTYMIIALADNLLITQPQRVPGISLNPIESDLGDDARVVLNRILHQRKLISFFQAIPKEAWLKQVRDARPAVQIECFVKAENADAAREFGSDEIRLLLDMMTLRRGAAARLIAGIMLLTNGQNDYQYQGAWIDHNEYSENLLGGVLAGENMHALQDAWSGLNINPRAQLWVSLYADAVRDPRWEYRLFRCFNLLEAIADTVVQENTTIVDQAGKPRTFRSGKGNYTTRQAQGKVYTLLLRLIGNNADDNLWDEVGHWVCVRNEVAHDGTWKESQSGETPEHAATRAFITSLGHDVTFNSGTAPFVNKIRNSVERVLNASINGTV